MKPMKPILFNTEMVTAILAGRKTATRRVVKEQKQDWKYDGELSDSATVLDIDDNGVEYIKPLEGLWATFENTEGFICCEMVKAAYQPGDILYVREAWAKVSTPDGDVFVFRANRLPFPLDGVKWRPSIHMPREAARLFLRVTDVRVSRLRPMSLDDLEAEGVDITPGFYDATMAFADLWDSTIQKKDLPLYGWEANPWVWVYEFEVITKEEAEEA